MRRLHLLLPILLILPSAALANEKLPDMTTSVLRHCVSIDIDLDGEKSKLVRLGQETRSSDARLNVAQRELRYARENVDRANPEAREALARQRSEYNDQVDAHNELVARLNAARERHNELIDRFNADCLKQLRSDRDWMVEKSRQTRERRTREQKERGEG